MIDALAFYDEADTRCQLNGMSLFDLDTLEAKKALLDFTNMRFNPKFKRLFHISGKSSGKCSAVANYKDYGVFDVHYICDKYFQSYCQFFRDPKTMKAGKL
jgi:hypothetical protein